MARVDLLECDNCGADVVVSPEAHAAMTQVVVTRGGSRSHVYDLCPNCASGFSTTLPDNPAEWPRFVSREAVQHWLRAQQAQLVGGNPWDNPEQRAAEKKRQALVIREPMDELDAKARREAEGDLDHVRRPTEYGDA